MIEAYFKSIKEPVEILKIYTDGACSNNGKKTAKAGVGIHCKLFEVSEKFPFNNHTNNRAELYAILYALNIIQKNKFTKKYEEILIYTDSEYSIKSCTKWIHSWVKNNWKKPVKNREFIEPIYSILKENPRIKLIHIKAHTGYQDEDSVGNDIADQLAVKSLKSSI